MLYIVDCDRERTTVHRVNYGTGEYLIPRYLKGSFDSQIFEIIELMTIDKCSKITFDKSGIARGLYDWFIHEVSKPNVAISIDEFGNVIHNHSVVKVLFGSKFENTLNKRMVELVADDSDYYWMSIIEVNANPNLSSGAYADRFSTDNAVSSGVGAYNFNREELQELWKAIGEELIKDVQK